MKKTFLSLLSILCMSIVAMAQDAPTPIYTADAVLITEDEDFGESGFPATSGIKAEAYDGYVILRSWSGVEGRDLKVSFDEDEIITEIVPIRNGVEQDAITSNAWIYTGLEEPSSIYVYLEGWSFASYEGEEGYVYLYAYIGNAYSYYYCVWGYEEEDPEEDDALYTALGEVCPTEGWGETAMPELTDVKVLGYEDYVVIKAFAGVSGYDIKVSFGEYDSVTGITSIVDGEEGTTVAEGYATVPTGREDYPVIKFYIGEGYCYGNTDAEEESGYFISRAFIGEDFDYYFIYWPQDDTPGKEWTNPFEKEATLLYSCTGDTYQDEEYSDYFAFPEIENIKVDVYDTYIYIHGIAGVEGYDAKVAYNEDEEVLSMIGIVDGVESSPSREYIYLATGLDAYPTIQAYNDYSYAGIYEDGTGYVFLFAYIYDENGGYEWGYYYLAWDKNSTGISVIDAEFIEAPAFNILGQPVKPDAKGIVIKDGMKSLNR